MKFPWFKMPLGEGGAQTVNVEVPAIRITVFNGDNHNDYYAWIDSGAEVNIFPTFIARRLGFDLAAAPRGRAVACGGLEFVTFNFDRISIAVEGDRFDIPVRFVDSAKQPPLLGLSGFFDRYKVIIDKKKRTVELKKY